MDLILLTAVIDGAPTSAVRFEVSINGGAFQVAEGGDLPFIRLTGGARPLPITIRCTANSPDFWPIEGSFFLRAPGHMDSVVGTPGNFHTPRGVDLGNDGAISVVVTLSRLRDRTSDVMIALGNVPAVRSGPTAPFGPPATWPP